MASEVLALRGPVESIERLETRQLRQLFPLRSPCIFLIRCIWWLILINQLPEILFSPASRTCIPTICPAEVSNCLCPSQGPDVSAELVAFRSAVRLHLLGTTVWVRRNFDPIYPFPAWGELLTLTRNLNSLHIRGQSPKKKKLICRPLSTARDNLVIFNKRASPIGFGNSVGPLTDGLGPLSEQIRISRMIHPVVACKYSE